MIMDILSQKTQCFLMFGHAVEVSAGKRRGLPVLLVIHQSFFCVSDIVNHNGALFFVRKD